jgi:hypothetical protein
VKQIFLLLRSLIEKFVDCHCELIQPKTSETFGVGGNYGALGGGWKGVRAWCQNLRKKFPDLATYLNESNTDILIIHVDADVARDNEMNCAMPCPPAQDTCEAVAQQVRNWLGYWVTENNVVLCIPADNTEAWILAAHDTQTTYHNPPDKPLECVQKPDMIISNQRYKKTPSFVENKKWQTQEN